MSEGAKNTFSLPSGSVPYDYLSMLQKAADEHKVVAGAGGAVTVLTLEDAIIGPSNEGLGNMPGGQNILTSDPMIASPDLSSATIWSQEIGAGLLKLLTGLPTETTVSSYSQNATSTDEELAYIQLAEQMYATGAENPPSDVSTTSANMGTNIPSDFQTWIDSFSTDLDPETTVLSESDQEILSGMQSTDPSAIKAALVVMANLNSLNLNASQKTFVEGKLQELANTLALVNKDGGSVLLNLTIPELILPVLVAALNVTQDASLTEDQRAKLTAALTNISTGTAKVNFMSLVQTESQSEEYTVLTSQDPAKLATLLTTMCETASLVVDLSPEALNTIMNNVATELSAINPEELSSMDDSSLTKTIQDAFDSALSSVDISDAQKASVQSAFIPVIVSTITTICTDKLTTDLQSTDLTTVETSLTTLVKIDDDLSVPSKVVIRDYLTALTQALVFLAQIRATIASLEGSLTQELAKAKLSQIADQITFAVKNLQTEFKKIDKQFEKTIKDINHAALMKKLMPMIALFVAVIAVVVAIVCTAVAIVTAGAGIPTLVAAIVGTISIIVALASVGVATADMTCTMTSGKGMWEQLATAAGIKDPALKALFTTAIQLIIDAIIIACTLGAGAAVVGISKGITSAALGITKGVSSAVESGLKAAAAMGKATLKASFNLSTVAGQIIAGSLVTAVFSGGLITIVLAKLGKLLFKNDKDGNIFAMAMSILLMLIFAIATGKIGGGKGATATTTKLATTAEEASEGVAEGGGVVSQIGNTIGSATKSIATYLENFLGGIGGTVEATATIAEKGLKDCLSYIASLILAIAKQLVKNLLTEISQVPQNLFANVKSQVTGIGSELAKIFGPLFSKDPLACARAIKESLLNLDNLAHLGITGMNGIHLATDALTIYAQVCVYQKARFNAKFEKSMASLEVISASLQALMEMLAGIKKGGDATQVIKDIADSAEDEANRWTALVQLVESFITSASSRLNELATRGAA